MPISLAHTSWEHQQEQAGGSPSFRHHRWPAAVF
jgi:hypothetical protein